MIGPPLQRSEVLPEGAFEVWAPLFTCFTQGETCAIICSPRANVTPFNARVFGSALGVLLESRFQAGRERVRLNRVLHDLGAERFGPCVF